MSETKTPLFIRCCYYMLRNDVKCTTEVEISKVLKQNFGTAYSAPMTQMTVKEVPWIRPFIYPAPDTATTWDTYYSERIKRAGALLLNKLAFQSEACPTDDILMTTDWWKSLPAYLTTIAGNQPQDVANAVTDDFSTFSK